MPKEKVIEIKNTILSIIDKNLTNLEKRVLTLKYGLEDGCQKTFEEISKELNISVSTVKGLETRALRKLRKSK